MFSLRSYAHPLRRWRAGSRAIGDHERHYWEKRPCFQLDTGLQCSDFHARKMIVMLHDGVRVQHCQGHRPHRDRPRL